MKNTIVKDTLILFIITLIAGFGLAAVYGLTKEPIAQADYNKQQNAYKTVFPDADQFVEIPDFDSAAATELSGCTNGDTVNGCVQAVGADGSLLGYVVTVTDPNGYGGDITLSIGVTLDGTLNGYAITTIAETPGLGMKAKEPAFADQFAGKSCESYVVTKATPAADNEIQAITGSTITSDAVTGGVNTGLAYYRELLNITGGELK